MISNLMGGGARLSAVFDTVFNTMMYGRCGTTCHIASYISITVVLNKNCKSASCSQKDKLLTDIKIIGVSVCVFLPIS